ncbi:hypothetical protein ACWF82_19415 [Nocardia sp. NPDC055053]
MTREWRVGRVFVLRHAGMPFDWLETFTADAALLAAAQDVLDREATLLAAAGAHADTVRSAVRRGSTATLPALTNPDARAAVREWADAARRFEHAYEDADAAAGDQLREVLRRPEVGEAVFLSNPDAYRNMLVPYLSHEGVLNSRWRRVRRQMYTYVQRFCAKNETVSFFGPMAYGTAGATTRLHRGRPRVRRVFLSEWAVRTVIRAIARDTRLLPHLRFHPVAPTGTVAPETFAELPIGGTRFIDLVRTTGRPAREIAADLRKLLADGAADVELGGGEYDTAPLSTLRDQLAAMPPLPARNEWIDRIDELESLRAALEDQPLDKRMVTVATLEQRFTEITGKPARRGAGATYADRAIFFEECSSEFDLEISEEQLAEWERRLTPLLEVAVAHGAATQQAAVEVVRGALTDAGHDPDESMTLAAWSTRAAAALEEREASTSRFRTGHAPTYSGEAADEEISTLLEKAAALRGDRYAVVDLCPRATGEHALPGAPLIVARTHHHLLVHSWLATMFDDPGQFAADANEWITGCAGELVGLDFGRRNKGYYRFPGPEVAFRPLSWVDTRRKDLLTPDEVTVTPVGEQVELRDPRGRRLRTYVPLSDFVKFPPTAALSHPQVVHPVFANAQRHQPEVEVEGVVVQRARWEVATDELTASTPSGRFLNLRRLARLTGSRFVFCRSATERKPYLLDLAAPLAADLLAHIAKQPGELDIEPMSPEPEMLWLRDQQGHRYTSEARIQVIGHDAEEAR